MSDPAGVNIVAIQELISVKMFLAGASEHIDGLAGYVRDFLAEHEGEPNDRTRPWTVESCADALKIPAATLRRWLDQGESAPVLPFAKAEQVKVSHAKSALRDPVQRRAVVEGLSTGQRDELRADLISVDIPGSTECRHCATHCPSDTPKPKSGILKPKSRIPKPLTEDRLKMLDERDRKREETKLKDRMAARRKKDDPSRSAVDLPGLRHGARAPELILDYAEGADGVWRALDTKDPAADSLGVASVTSEARA